MARLPDDFPTHRVLQQMLDLFVKPEIERRAAAGELEMPVHLTGFQVILRDDGPPEVRLNGEVKAIAKVHVASDREIREGDPVYPADLGEFEGIELTDDDDPDCAHVTCVFVNGVARLSFDFRYNRGLAARHLETASEFLETAREALASGRTAAFADALLSAAELAARATLLTMPDKKFKKKATHGEIQKRHARFVTSGNADIEHASVLGELRKLRDPLRYVTAERDVSPEQAEHYLSTVEDMLDYARCRIG